MTKKQKVLEQLELMIASTHPDMAGPAGSGDPVSQHERFHNFHRRVSDLDEGDPDIDEVAREIGLPTE